MASGVFNLKQQLFALAQQAWSGPQRPKHVEYLCVAGGGGGGGTSAGNGAAGGGGAGGLLTGIIPVVAETSYTATVGAGGAGGATTATGTVGVNSVFGNITVGNMM